MLNYERKPSEQKIIDSGWTVPEFAASHRRIARRIARRIKLTIYDYGSDGCDVIFDDTLEKITKTRTFFDDKGAGGSLCETKAEDWLMSLVPAELINHELPRYDQTYCDRRRTKKKLTEYVDKTNAVPKRRPGSPTTTFKQSHNGFARSTLHACYASLNESLMKRYDPDLVADGVRIGVFNPNAGGQYIRLTSLGMRFAGLIIKLRGMTQEQAERLAASIDDFELLCMVESYTIASNWRLTIRNAISARMDELAPIIAAASLKEN